MKTKKLGKLPDDQLLNIKLITHPKLNQEQLDILTGILNENNLHITKTTDLFIDTCGASKDFSKLFETEIHSFHNKTTNHKYFSHNDVIVIPPELNFISDVIGFHTKPIARTSFHVIREKRIHTSADLTSFTPLQLAHLYNFPSYTGAGQTIAIIELGGGYVQDDLTHYFQSLNLGAGPTVIAIGVDGTTNDPADTSGANGEVVLDIEVAGAIAPHSKIVVYFAPNTLSGFYNAIYEAINDTTNKPSVISISWGSAEVNWSKSTMLSYDHLFATAVTKGINVFVASGDNGANDNVEQGGLHVDFPASSVNVVACGGTRLHSNGTTIQSEVVWNDGTGGGSSGGGFSTVFTKPSYQSGISTIKTKRGVPDVSANASPYSGYEIYMDGQTQIIGGTSAVAPLMAGLIARINQAKGSSIGFINPHLYHNKLCVDITSGNNHGYSAKTGWDPCTGLGRIIGNLTLTKL